MERSPLVIRKVVDLAEVRPLLRVAVGLRPFESPATLTADAVPEAAVVEVDTGAWMAWSLAGLRLFAAPQLPSLRRTVTQARRVLLSLALDRSDGNISRMARWLGTSRRAVRQGLQTAGLYRGSRGDRVAGGASAASVLVAQEAGGVRRDR